jgi:RND family efflux transporter MFP subunit
LQSAPEYTGTTEPLKEVSLRSQAEGQLLDLRVDVGDRVSQGQVLARLKDDLLVAAVLEAQAELAALESEVARARTQVGNARTQAEQARLSLIQAQADAARSRQLVGAGAIARQAAQLDQTEARTAAQGLRSAQVQIRTEQQAVAAAQRRVTAQRAVVAQAQEQQSYAVLKSPITGLVLQRPTESGNLVQIGDEVLRLGDFSRVKAVVQVSELELAKIRVGQSAQVRLDALPNQQFTGEVVRISPAADPTARLLPIEVTIPNSDGRIGSGLLARVSFAQRAIQRIVVPETALQETGQRNGRSTLFVVTGAGNQARVAARQVAVGEHADGQVEIISGLRPGERFVARSGKPLKDGEAVRLSILSEKS